LKANRPITGANRIVQLLWRRILYASNTAASRWISFP
jgi:hypothetical protein